MIWATADFVVWHLCGKDFESDVDEYNGIWEQAKAIELGWA